MQGQSDAIGARANCQADLGGNDVVAQETKRGLATYQVLKQASALVNPNGVYCYLEAVASSKPDDSYLWSIPAGIS
jgi:hypothetical protein